MWVAVLGVVKGGYFLFENRGRAGARGAPIGEEIEHDDFLLMLFKGKCFPRGRKELEQVEVGELKGHLLAKVAAGGCAVGRPDDGGPDQQ